MLLPTSVAGIYFFYYVTQLITPIFQSVWPSKAWPIWILHVAGTIEVCFPNVSFFSVEYMFVYPSTCSALLICSLNCSTFTFKSVKYHCRNTHKKGMKSLEKQWPIDEGEGVRNQGPAVGRRGESSMEGVRGSTGSQFLRRNHRWKRSGHRVHKDPWGRGNVLRMVSGQWSCIQGQAVWAGKSQRCPGWSRALEPVWAGTPGSGAGIFSLCYHCLLLLLVFKNSLPPSVDACPYC